MVRQAQTSWCGFSPAFLCACRHHALGWLLPEQLTDRPLFIRPSATRDSRGIIGCVPTRLTPKFRTVQVAPPGLMALLFPISRPSMPCKLEPGIQLRKRTYTDLCGSATPLVPGKSCPSINFSNANFASISDLKEPIRYLTPLITVCETHTMSRLWK